MSAITRFGPKVAKSALFHHPTRHLATATAGAEPIQKLFVDKIREFKSSKQGLDAAHQKAMTEEMARLKRVYNVLDESKIAHMDHNFPNEVNVSLHDIDENKDLRQRIASGEYQKSLSMEPAEKSELLASIPEQVTHDLHLPPYNKPDFDLIFDNHGTIEPCRVGDTEPDYKFIGDKMTPHRLQREMRTVFSDKMPTIHDDKKPERDVVNFPRQPVLEYAPPTRYHVIPESWFRFFYPKTGVSGPYAFAASFGSFLVSKEWIIYEHELLTGITSTAIFTYAVIKYGPKLSNWANSKIKAEGDNWENWRLGNIKCLDDIQTHYKGELDKTEAINHLYDIRKHDVEMQLEHEYRNRIKSVYEDTKRRLNYLVSVADSQRQIAHKNMVNWVISNAVNSIGQKQENEVLDSCIANLKQLSMKNANVV